VKCLISFVYGPPYQKCSSDFWSQLAEFGYDNFLPWLCIGDFNSITSSLDKLGGRPFNALSHNDFGYFMNAFGMIDLGFLGNPFTWSNHRQGHGLIKERLDRGVVSSQWLHEFPAISVTHLPAYSSDHNPLILNTVRPSPSLPIPFRFEEFWTRDPMCGIVINEAWSTAVSGSSSSCLAQKLKITKKAIKYWNKYHFSDIKSKLDSTLLLLDITQQASPSDYNLGLELHLKSLLNEYYLQEESLWKSKSRELWLTCKDLNTRFFHTSTLIRRRRNTIDLLQTSNGGWISDRRDIGDCFVSHFRDTFTSSNSAPSDELLDLFQCSISDADNLMLCSIPFESEIHDALASLGLSKAPGPDALGLC
jgi:hypothetical protein